MSLRVTVLMRLLLADTWRQARASGVAAMMLSVTAVAALLCLSVEISGDVPLHDDAETVMFLPSSVSSEAARRDGIATIDGRVRLAFGAVSFPICRERIDAVRFLETLLAGGIAGTLGLLMALVWTAGFLPTFLEPSMAMALLARPVSRRRLLLGKAASVVLFVGLQVALFVASTWLCLGVRTSVWDATYLKCIPLLVLQFAVYYGASVLLATATRSTVACVFGSLLFWLVSWGINYASVMVRALPEGQRPPAVALALADASYWISPKPIDAASILFDGLEVRSHFEEPQAFRLLKSRPGYSSGLSVASSLLLTGVLLGLASYEFGETDY